MLDSILADREMIVDIIKNGTMLVVSRLLVGGKLTDSMWEMSILYILIGFIVFNIVVKRLIPSNLFTNRSMKRAIRTVSKYGTMFIVSKVLTGEKIDIKWIKSTSFILIGFLFYDIVTYKLVPTEGISSHQIKLTVDDTAKMVTVAIISRLLEGKSFKNKDWLLSVLFTIFGFSVYNLGISNLI